MVQEVKLPTTPEQWAITLSRLLSAVHGKDKFPIDVTELAKGYSAQAFPNEAITLVAGDAFPEGLEGMLLPHPSRNGQWCIFFNNNVSSTGRQNFTLAHEFGHYLLHRHLHPEGFRCGFKAMHEREIGDIETEANRFASMLLMPFDDFRKQTLNQKPTLTLMKKLADRYQVSITAAMIHWLEITEYRAMVVAGLDGFIDWARSSQPLFKSGIFYRARQETVELPEGCLAKQSPSSLNLKLETNHTAGIWLGDEPVEESVFFLKGGRSISLVVYPKTYIPVYDHAEEEVPDTYEVMKK